MRADRLVALVLLLRQRGRLSAPAIARELEVSTRTVLRDVEALSAAGVPVYATRGRTGGIALLAGFRAELTGLTADEVTALVATASARGAHPLGLGATLAGAARKVVDALPPAQQVAAALVAERFLVEPETDLLSRRSPAETPPPAVTAAVRRAVVEARRLRLLYPTGDAPPRWRTVDPVGVVSVRGVGYLLARHDGADRTYRLARVRAAEVSPAPADRPDTVDLARVWRERGERFRTGGDLRSVMVRVRPERRDDVLATAVAVRSERLDDDDWLRLEAVFQDDRHARWALWQWGTDAEVVAPDPLRAALHEKARALAERYAPG